MKKNDKDKEIKKNRKIRKIRKIKNLKGKTSSFFVDHFAPFMRPKCCDHVYQGLYHMTTFIHIYIRICS